MTQACSIYGLGLQSNVSIAGLRGLRTPSNIDVSLTIGSLPPESEAFATEPPDEFFVADDLDTNGLPSVRVSRRAQGRFFRIEYSDGTVVVVESNGAAIWARGCHGATVEDTATYLLGPVLGFLLRLRGVTCLHASAVVVDGRAVAFVGPAGAGKSSTAAAFARAGYPVLADDVVPLHRHGDRFTAQPGYPRLRLWPDSGESLFGKAGALPRITPTWDKRYLDLNGPGVRFEREPMELAAVYLLGARAAMAEIRPLDKRAALISLVRETCAARLLDRALRATEFEFLGRLVDSVPVRRLHAPDDLGRISQACDAVIGDLERLDARAA